MKEKINKKGVFMSFNSNNFSSFWDTSSDNNVDEFLGIEEDKPKGKDVVALNERTNILKGFSSPSLLCIELLLLLLLLLL